jgi:hypothetical protein
MNNISKKKHIIFFPHIKVDKKKENKEKGEKIEKIERKPLSKIHILDYNTKNEIEISNFINKIINYNERFHIILKYSLVNLTEVDNFLGLVNTTNYEPYAFLSYSFVDFPKHLPFNEYFLSIKCPRKAVLIMMNSFKYLMKSLELLCKYNIVHFHLTFKNILFNQLDIPFIKGFTYSFQLLNLCEERKDNLMKNINIKSPFTPLELHICEFLYNNSVSLSKSNIEQVCNNFFDNILLPLGIISEDYLGNYKENVIFSLQCYVNKPKDMVINDIINKYSYYWDIYSLALNYLLLIKELNKSSNACCQFYEDFTAFLIETACYLFIKREESLHSHLYQKYEKIIENCDFDDLIL